MLSFSSKKKDRWRPRGGGLPDSSQPGALSWQVSLDDSSQSTFVDCYLAISADSVVIIEEATREIVFVTPTKAVLGWSTNTNRLLFLLLLLVLRDNDHRALNSKLLFITRWLEPLKWVQPRLPPFVNLLAPPLTQYISS